MGASGDLSARMRQLDSSTTEWAREAFEAGRQASFVALALRPPWVFLRDYLLRGGVLGGAEGLRTALFSAYAAGIGLAKLSELGRQAGRHA